MTHPLEQLRDDALREIEAALDEQALESARVKYLGKTGSVSAWGELSSAKRIGRARQDRHLAAGDAARNRHAAPAHAGMGTFDRNFSANGLRACGRTGH